MSFEERLTGGHPNSLGNTVEVVEEVLSNHKKFNELFECYFSHDEVVRLRTSNAIKRVCKVEKALLIPYINKFIDEISNINQASTQWTLSQLFDELAKEMTSQQRQEAMDIMKNNLAHHQDWIVLNQTMNTLGKWSKKDRELKLWLKPHLERISKDERKSVSQKAIKLLKSLK